MCAAAHIHSHGEFIAPLLPAVLVNTMSCMVFCLCVRGVFFFFFCVVHAGKEGMFVYGWMDGWLSLFDLAWIGLDWFLTNYLKVLYLTI